MAEGDVNADYFMMVVAVLGTTISPYLFFWQASQEVEEMNQGKRDKPLREEPQRGGDPELARIKVDTIVGMLLSNGIAFFIILTTAAVLNANGVTNINSATEAAEALRPLAGDFTFALFALGIIGTGLLAIPVLAGSAAYGVAEIFGWRATLEAKPEKAVGFYTIIAAATVIGFGLGFTGISAIHMLVWSAVLNGIVAVPIMAMMMLIVSNGAIMGRFKARSWLVALGWLGTALMALAVLALLGSSAIGCQSGDSAAEICDAMTKAANTAGTLMNRKNWSTESIVVSPKTKAPSRVRATPPLARRADRLSETDRKRRLR